MNNAALQFCKKFGLNPEDKDKIIEKMILELNKLI